MHCIYNYILLLIQWMKLTSVPSSPYSVTWSLCKAFFIIYTLCALRMYWEQIYENICDICKNIITGIAHFENSRSGFNCSPTPSETLMAIATIRNSGTIFTLYLKLKSQSWLTYSPICSSVLPTLDLSQISWTPSQNPSTL